MTEQINTTNTATNGAATNAVSGAAANGTATAVPQPSTYSRSTLATKFTRANPPCVLLRHARRILGVRRGDMARAMGIPSNLFARYENGVAVIPSEMLLKIFIFGLDFWCGGINWGASTDAGTIQCRAAQAARRAACQAAPGTPPTDAGDLDDVNDADNCDD